MRFSRDAWLRIVAPTSGLICSALFEGDGGAGGDGTGGGAGGSGGDLSQESRDLIMRTVNAAVTSQLGRKLPEAISAGMTAALTPLQEQIAALVPAAAGGKDDDKDKGGDKDGQGDKDNPQLTAMANQIKALTSQISDEKAAREALDKEHKDAERTNSLRGALGKAGVRQELLDGAVATIGGNIHTVKDDKGSESSVWRMQREGYTEDLSLDVGTKEWLGTDTGKAYQAPVDVAGSGANPGRGGGPLPGARAADPKVAKMEGKQAALTKLGEQVRDMLSSGTVEL